MKPRSGEKLIDKNSLSQDLLFLCALNSRDISSLPAISKKPVNFVDLSKPKRSRIQHNVNIDDGCSFRGFRSRLDLGRVNNSTQSFQRIESVRSSQIRERGETPLPKEILERHIAAAESRNNSKIALQEKMISEAFNSPAKKDVHNALGSIRPTVHSTRDKINKENMTINEEIPRPKIPMKASVLSKRRFFPQKPVTEMKNVTTCEDEKASRSLGLTDVINDALLSHSTPVASTSHQIPKTTNSKDYKLFIPIKENRDSFSLLSELGSQNQRSGNERQEEKSPTVTRRGTNVGTNKWFEISTNVKRLSPSFHGSDRSFDHQISPESASNQCQITDQKHVSSQSNVSINKLNIETTDAGIAQFSVKDRDCIDKTRFDFAGLMSFKAKNSFPNRDHANYRFHESAHALGKARECFSSPVLGYPHVIEDRDSPMSSFRAKRLNTDQLCPRELEVEAGEMHEFQDDSDEDRFRQEMFKQKSAFNLSFQSDIDKEMIYRPGISDDDKSTRNTDMNPRAYQDFGVLDKEYHIPDSSELHMTQSVPEALVEVLEMEVDCIDNALSPEYPAMKSVDSNEDPCLPLDAEEAILLKKEASRESLEDKTHTREDSIDELGSKDYNREFEQDICFEADCLLPCTKGTQTNLLEMDSRKEVSDHGSEAGLTSTEPPLQAKSSTSVQTDALYCSKCECLVCDLLSDIEAENKPDFEETRTNSVDISKDCFQENQSLETFVHDENNLNTEEDFIEEPGYNVCDQSSPTHVVEDVVDRKQSDSDLRPLHQHERGRLLGSRNLETFASSGLDGDTSGVQGEACNKTGTAWLQDSWDQTREPEEDLKPAEDLGLVESNPFVLLERRAALSQTCLQLSPCVIQTRSRTASMRCRSKHF